MALKPIQSSMSDYEESVKTTKHRVVLCEDYLKQVNITSMKKKRETLGVEYQDVQQGESCDETLAPQASSSDHEAPRLCGQRLQDPYLRPQLLQGLQGFIFVFVHSRLSSQASKLPGQVPLPRLCPSDSPFPASLSVKLCPAQPT